MKSHKIVFALLFMLTFCYLLPAADNAVIVRSPYYGTTSSIEEANQLPNSYAAQLGMADQETMSAAITPESRVLAAISNNRYPVTPGDTIRITYTEGRDRVDLTVQVDGSYSVVIPSIGTVNGANKPFVTFAREVERLIENYFPFSLPRVVLTGTGVFTVTVRGEVYATQEVSAWGLSRLSSVISSAATEFASTRSVHITSAQGEQNTYDLYAALREGDLSQNPLVRAGDIITIPKADRLITIAGEVARPGVYQPREDEELEAIMQRYGGGILPSGDAFAVLVRRYGIQDSAHVDVLRVAKKDYASFALNHLDTVFVSPIAPLSRAITLEGAVNMGDATTQSSALSSSGRVYYQFFPGETVLEMMQAIAHRFSAVSDLAAAYVIRADQFIPVNIQTILMGGNEPIAQLPLQEGDRFVIPFNQLFVNVTGGVLRPGTFPYIPDKTASYYINLAGGFDPAKNRNGAFTMTDKTGKELAKDAIVPPEAIVTAKLNTFQAVNGMNLATTVTIVGLIATILGIVANIVTFPN